MHTDMDSTPKSQHFTFPAIREVEATRALDWLRRGFADMRAQPGASAFYGLCFGAMGVVLLLVFRFAIDYTSTLAMGFMLLGPFLCIGLYDLSRQREASPPANFRRSLVAWRENPGGIGIYVLILTVVFLVWARASLVTFALFESHAMPTWAAFFLQLAAMQNIGFMMAFFGVGLIFATIVFAFSVISIPYLLDRRADAITAAAVSVMSLVRNPVAMIVWAALIALLIGVGLLTAYIGLVLTGPLIGHATWHAYRDLVGPACWRPAPKRHPIHARPRE
ncbi:MAG: DUF2189 domain-containing protein [Betaproteobacteria bacterium]|nr:DUF2189 domain-containing protein [Betaproteobacteria bacterium]